MPLDTPPPAPARPASPSARPGASLTTAAPGPWDPVCRIREARGAHLIEAGGRRLLDLDNAGGAVLLGHGDPAVARAIARAATQGIAGLPSLLAEELAERLAPLLPAGFRTGFLHSGGEALRAAAGLARAATNRAAVILALEPGDGPPAATLGSTRSVRPGDLAGVEALLQAEAGHVAAILADPLGGAAAPGDWPAALQRLAQRHGALLVFDERASFLRAAAGGITRLSGVTPDLLCHGEGLANGLPLAALSGPDDLLRRLPEHAAASAMGGLAAAAAHTVLDRLALADGPVALGQAGAALREGFEMALAAVGMHGAYRLEGIAARLVLRAAGGQPAVHRLSAALAEQGVHMTEGFSPSLAFGTVEMLEATTAFARALRRLRGTEAPGAR